MLFQIYIYINILQKKKKKLKQGKKKKKFSKCYKTQLCKNKIYKYIKKKKKKNTDIKENEKTIEKY